MHQRVPEEHRDRDDPQEHESAHDVRLKLAQVIAHLLGLVLQKRAAAAAELVAGGAKTTNAQLQQRLTLLAELGARGDVDGFVRVFVPHDLTQDDTEYFAGELKEDATRWKQLVEELTLIADGSKVTKIVGDQVTKAEFRYFMPNQQLSIQREVVFTCENGDWRAEG